LFIPYPRLPPVHNLVPCPHICIRSSCACHVKRLEKIAHYRSHDVTVSAAVTSFEFLVSEIFNRNTPSKTCQNSSRKHNFNSVYTARFKTRRVVRKGSIYRTGVVLKTKVNLYFYRMWCGIYFQNYYSIPKSTQAVNSSQKLLPRPHYFNLDHIMFLHHCENLK
jgi:hypothetical protein